LSPPRPRDHEIANIFAPGMEIELSSLVAALEAARMLAGFAPPPASMAQCRQKRGHKVLPTD
jgi:hypothetical protein